MMKLFIKASQEQEIIIRTYVSELYDSLNADYTLHNYQSDMALDQSDTILFYEIMEKDDIKKLEDIRHKHGHAAIIVMHDSMQFLFDSFKVKALAYINYATLEEDLEKLKEILKQEIVIANASFHYASGFMHFDIDPRKVLYVESYHHDVYIHTSCMKLKIRGNLKNYIIDNNYLHLIQVHKSYVVNLDYVEEIQGDCLQLKNKEMIPSGKHYQDSLNVIMAQLMK